MDDRPPTDMAPVVEKLCFTLEKLLQGDFAGAGASLPEPDASAGDPALSRLAGVIRIIVGSHIQGAAFINALAAGSLEAEAPRKNLFFSPLKSLQASLRHLRWLSGQIAMGNLDHEASYLGDFSESFNRLMEALKEKEKLEQRLRIDEERYRAIVEAAAYPIIITDSEDYLILYLNSRAEKQFLVTREMMTGKTTHTFYESPEERDRLISLFKEKGSLFDMEVRLRRSDGELFWALISIGHLTFDGKKAICISLNEITELKKAQADLMAAKQAAEEASRAKSIFLANMSHEIRTPMNAIVGFLELLGDRDLGAEHQEYVRETKNASEYLLHLISDILDLSKIEAGRMELERVDFNALSLVEDVISLNAPMAFQKSLEIYPFLDLMTPAWLSGDPGRLKQVLNNLISNAVKFTEHGEITVTLSSEDMGDRGVKLSFSVEDTGIGIRSGDGIKLFEAFSQADASTTRVYGGTGLGLAISKRIVEMMGGSIAMKSNPGEGSSFAFSVVMEKGAFIAREHSDDGVPRLEGITVLIVDDCRKSREVIKNILSPAGCPIIEAESGPRAMELLIAGKMQCGAVIVDSDMPGMDGPSLIAALKALEPANPLPVILLEPPSGKREPESGTLTTVTRPIRHKELLMALLKALGRDPCLLPVEAAAIARSMKGGERADPAHLRILLVEDNRTNQKVFTAMLKTMGYSCDIAADGSEAVEASLSRDYHLIFMDCMMPVMDGYQATMEIRRREKSLSRVPIIAMTAFAMKEDRDKCLAAGMDDYISKPVSRETLRNILTKYGEHAQRARDLDAVPPPFAIDEDLPLKVIDSIVDDLAIERSEAESYLNSFMESLPLSLDRIDRHLAAGAINEAYRELHRLNGSSGCLRMKKLSRLFAACEEKAGRDNIEETAVLFRETKAYAAALSTLYRRHFSQMR
ncbi:MAG: response regulator [Candidatus Eremiobacteraeota bacterium]|nr:response regulator [Candidatus Eremiobacteraeota bacterium]